MRKIASLLAVALWLLLPTASFAQDYEQDDGDQAMTDDGPVYYSNNPCESGDLGDGTPVNCDNALGADQHQVIWHHAPQFHPHVVQVWQPCGLGWALVNVIVNQMEGE